MPKEDVAKRLAEIRERLDKYRKHRDDAYAYDPREIDEVRDFYNNAEEDIAFLLEQTN